MSLSARQSTNLRDIAPFNPQGSHPPGTFPPGLFPTGSAPLNPSYPIRPPDTMSQQRTSVAAFPGTSPQLAVEMALQLDKAYQTLFQMESFILACPNSLAKYDGMIQEKFELFASLEDEAEEQEVKAALRAVAARFRAELESSNRAVGPRFRPVTTVIRLLFFAAQEQANTLPGARLHSLAEQYRDAQAGSITQNQLMLISEDSAVRERVSQKVSQYESLMDKHDDSVSLCANCIQKQFNLLSDMDKEWNDEAASHLLRIVAEMYRATAIQSLNTRITPISTMLSVMARVEEQQTDPIAKVRVSLMAKMYRQTMESVLDLAQALKQAPWDKSDILQATTSPSISVPEPAQAITAQPRHVSIPASPHGGLDPQFGGLQTPIHPLSPSWSTGNSTVYDSASSQYGTPFYPSTPQLSSMHNTIHGQPATPLQSQYSMNTLASPSASAMVSKDDPVPPYPGEPVPLLARQPKVSFGEGGTIKSKDVMLNTNGDALYRYILDNLGAPTFRLHCYGSHTVTDIVANGKEVKTVERTVVDFDFVIDLALSMQLGPGTLYVLDDSTWAYRGKMYKEMGRPNLPQSVHAWAKDYAASPKTGKEFRFRKAVVGLDRSKTIDAINQIINSTGHSTYRKVYFSVTNSAMQVRVDSALMTMIKNSCISCLLWLVCVWPIVWLIRRYGTNGGKWDVCRASYVCDRDPRDEPGSSEGVPLGDGDWVKIWERTLRLAIGNRIKTSSPIYRPTANDSGVILFD